MTAPVAHIADARSSQRMEASLLHGAMTFPDVWRTVEQYELGTDHFASARNRRVFDALRSHYATVDAAPVGGTVLLAHGALQADLDDWGGAPPVMPGPDAEALADAVRHQGERRQQRASLQRAKVAIDEGDAAGAAELLARVLEAQAPAVQWLSTAEIFEPLPPNRALVPGLQLGPGRVCQTIGYAGSGKTWVAQHIGVCGCTGLPVFGHFPLNTTVTVRHLDFDQGAIATRHRYRRLLAGAGLTVDDLQGRLQLASYPHLYLNQPGAVDAYCRAVDGAGLVIVDALRGASPGEDENDSRIRACVDVLTQVSERTGATVLLLHHAGKENASGDKRKTARGSSAIFDAAGSTFEIHAPTERGGVRKVVHTKPSPDCAGGEIEPFGLQFSDVVVGADMRGGMRITWASLTEADVQQSVKADADTYKRDADKLLATIRRKPRITQAALTAIVTMKKARALAVLAALESDGRLHVERGDHGAKLYTARGNA